MHAVVTKRFYKEQSSVRLLDTAGIDREREREWIWMKTRPGGLIKRRRGRGCTVISWSFVITFDATFSPCYRGRRARFEVKEKVELENIPPLHIKVHFAV